MICPNCFTENVTSICKKCGYEYNPATESNDILHPGVILNNRYRIGRCIGQGGFGVTYLAQDTFINKICAIKEYYPNQIVDRSDNNYLMVHNDNMLERFENGKKSFIEEARVLFRLQSCPLVVTVTDFFSEFNSAYIVMDYLDGMNLKKVLKKFGGKLSYSNSIKILIKMCNALTEVHQLGILHRDISPENIFVTNDGRIILIDFGAARNLDSDGMSVLIKPGYAPPEQYLYNGVQGPWTDIYALAATFYYIVSGIHIMPSRERMVDDKVLELSSVTSNVNPALSKVIKKAMELDYHERYQTIPDFLNDILNVINCKNKSILVPVIRFKQENGISEVVKLSSEKEFNIGRTSEKVVDGVLYKNDKIIHNTAVSGAHCTIKFVSSDNEFIVIDHSSNGTYFENGNRLCYGIEYRLKSKTTLFLARNNCCVFELDLVEE